MRPEGMRELEAEERKERSWKRRNTIHRGEGQSSMGEGGPDPGEVGVGMVWNMSRKASPTP